MIALLLSCSPDVVRLAPDDDDDEVATDDQQDDDDDDDDDDDVLVRPEPRFEAALDYANGKAYVFHGTDYIRYDHDEGEADEGYPLDTATWWDGVWADGIDAALLAEPGTAWFFRDDGTWLTFDVAADVATGSGVIADDFGVVDAIDAAVADVDGSLLLFSGRQVVRWNDGVVETVPIRQQWDLPEGWDGLDAALRIEDELVFFRGAEFVRVGTSGVSTPAGIGWHFPGLFDPYEGTGDPGANLPAAIEALLVDDPSEDEKAARKARVQQSTIGTDYVDISGQYPQYLESIEDRLGVYGCCILHNPTSGSYRFRCATDTAGPHRLDIDPYTIDWIDWRNAAYHVQQVSQGDFSADAGTPVSIFAADDDVFYVEHVIGNAPTGSISGGLNIRVRYTLDGVEHVLGFSHLDTNVPGYTIDAADTGDPLPVGTVFGFIGYTGNLWIGAPPASDGPYTGTGAGLPVAHSHIWFADDLDNHMALTPDIRQALDYSGLYPYGGG